jgi:hypothetical protein
LAERHRLYPDPDWPLLREALADRRIGNVRVAWDEPEVAWGRFDLVVVRSTWDSVDRPSEYLSWARAVAAVTRLENHSNVLAWNLDKSHLTDLERAGIPVVPTRWVPPDTEWAPPPGPFVRSLRSSSNNSTTGSPPASVRRLRKCRNRCGLGGSSQRFVECL